MRVPFRHHIVTVHDGVCYCELKVHEAVRIKWKKGPEDLEQIARIKKHREVKIARQKS